MKTRALFHGANRHSAFARAARRASCAALHVSLAIVFFCLALPVCLIATAETPADRAKNVLILNSGDSALPASMAITEGLRKVMAADPAWDLTFFAESLDAYRFPDPDALQSFTNALQAKYAATPIDLVFALGPEALELLIARRAELFPDVPVIFCAVQRRVLNEMPPPPPDFAGTVSQFDTAGSVRLALALQPKLKRIVVVTGAAPFDKTWADDARAQLKVFEPGLVIEHWSGLPMETLLRDLGGLGKDTAVLYLSMFVDGSGNRFVTQNAGRIVAEASSVPTYGVYSTLLGQGPVGGYFDRFEDMGSMAGDLGLRVLAGADPSSIPTASDGAFAYHVDWRQLEHWGLSEARLPPGTTLHFKPPTLWEQHRALLLGTLGVVILQSLLIALLLIHRRRRQEAEQSLRESEERMALATAAASLGLWHYDVRTGEVWATEHFREILDLPPEGDLRLETILGRLHPEDQAATREAVERAIETGRPSHGRFRVPRADGSTRWIEARALLEHHPVTGQPYRLNGLIMDVTQARQTEAEAERRREQLTHMTRVSILGELSGALAHELNQPLAAILSNAQAAQKLLARNPGNLAEVEDILSDIVADDRRAGDVIRKLRSLLKRGESDLNEIDLNALIEDTLDLAHGELVRRRVQLRKDLAKDLPPVLGDAVQLQQVLLNLIINGCDSMAQTPVPQRVLTVTSTNLGNAQACVSVADQGAGISTELKTQLFEPFVTTKATGLGIGLAVSQSIVAAHGGRIWAQNSPAGGAVFSFTVPASKGLSHEQPVPESVHSG